MATQRSIKAVPVDLDEQYDFDLDALVVDDEDAPPYRFRWGGKVFEMPLMMGMPFEEQLALEAATTEESLRIIMGDKTFEELVATRGGSDERRMSIGRMRALIDRWNRHQGLEPGESRASSRSSASTARQSRRTSRSTRARRTS